MEYKKGLVSVVIPTYKRSEMLSRAIESVLNQTYSDVECIVVNDNIPGDEWSLKLYVLIKKYSCDDRFKFIEQEVHKNGAAARNAGIMASTGEYISFLDDDDYYDERKIEKQVSYLSKLNDEYGGVSCLMSMYRDNKLIFKTPKYSERNLHFRVLSHALSLGTGTVLIRKRALEKSGYWDDNLHRLQDLQFFACLTKHFKIKLVPLYLHNREVKDAQNRPQYEKYREMQVAYIKSIEPLINDFGFLKRDAIYRMYKFELAPLCLKSGLRLKGLYYAITLTFNPMSLYYSLKLVMWKLKGKNLAK